MEAPVARKATRNQLGESRWAPSTRAKGQSLWMDPPKKFVKASDQSLMSAAPLTGSNDPKGNAYVPPHLRQTPAQAQQEAPKPESQHQSPVAPTSVAQYDVPGHEPQDKSPMSLAPVNLAGPAAVEADETPSFPVSTKHTDGISAPNPSLEASLAVFGLDPPKADPNRDPRGEVPVQTWTEQDWNQTRRPKKKKSFESKSISRDSDVSGTTSALNWAPDSRMTEWIGKWTDKIPDSVEASVLHDRPVVYEDCDVDCDTGELLAPVDYPRTMMSKLSSRMPRRQHTNVAQDPTDKTSSLKKRLHSTSETHTVRERKKREQELFRQKQQERIEKARLAPSEINEDTEPAMTRADPFQCRAESHIRPAQLGDMGFVAQLYQQEVETGWRALDQKPVDAQSWARILSHCHEHNLPFVVALSGYRDPRMPVSKAGHQVVGFAFLDVASRGIVGSVITNAKCSGRLYVIVAPQHRRARIGTALLDAVLKVVSPQYSPKELSYQWVNPRDDPTYFPRRHNPHSEERQWCSILMEVYVQNRGTKENTTKGEEYQAVWNWLEMDLSMDLISHSPVFGRADHLPTSPILDQLVFEHRCCPADIPV
ncbi:hypothetical protein PG985_006592 [Apiospora marii]|uniref:N-acetyltransferase domain-containing protein n=1 Tax=Apiospora marii TaxID=335849 RepID=A0ABR1S827_9PEZI